ncbi:hypothetical protein GQ457_06G016540 [Hibiscus cannabinus]
MGETVNIKGWWVLGRATVLWSMWLARNEATFKKKVTIVELLTLVKLRMFYWVCASHNVIEILGVVWWECCAVSSKVGVPKVNIDGSIRGKPGPNGCDKDVVRDENDTILAIFSSLLGILDSNLVEVYAILHGLLLLLSPQWVIFSSVVIESNSIIVVSWILNKEWHRWRYWRCFGEMWRHVQLLATGD